MQYLFLKILKKEKLFKKGGSKFLADYLIKPHAPPLLRVPANFFNFTFCKDYPRVIYLSVSFKEKKI
jgi:hypothetical protein